MAETVARRIDIIHIDLFTKETGITAGNPVSATEQFISPSEGYGYVMQSTAQKPRTPRGKYALGYVTVAREAETVQLANGTSTTYTNFVENIENTARPSETFDSVSDFQISHNSGYTFDISGGTFTPPGLFTRASSTSAVRNNISWSVPTGQYDVRLKRITPDSSSDRIRDEVQWTAFRTIRDTEPVDTDFADANNLAQTQIVIKATDQLNGIVDQLNAVCSSIIPDYDPGQDAWVNKTTGNCASVARHILQGTANKEPIPDSRLDIDTFEHLWQRCQDRLFQFNGVIQGGSVEDALKKVLSNARASRTMIDGVWSVVIDEEKTDVVQHFTPRNSNNFSGTKRFAKQPHALKIQFQNKDKGYSQDEVIVYDDGYSADGTNCEFLDSSGNCNIAAEFESIRVQGITLGEQAWQFGRYTLATNQLRPENYTLDVDLEHLVATRGDLVRITHDVPMFGLASGRVKSIQTSGSNTTGVTLDQELELEANTDYTIRFRLANGDTLTRDTAQVSSDTTTNSVAFSSAISTSSGPQIGDLAMFGLQNEETVDCIIKEIQSNGPDWGATLTLVDHAQPGIDDSADSAIPEHDSGITENPFTRQIPPDPNIQEVRSDRSALITHQDGSLEESIMVSYTVPSSDRFQVTSTEFRFRKSDESVNWDYISGPPQKGVVNLAPVDVGDDYDVQARTRTESRTAGNWVDVAQNHTVVGNNVSPLDVTGFTATSDGEGNVLLNWNEVADSDFDYFEIRRGSSWGSSEFIDKTLSTKTVIRDYDGSSWLIKAFNRSGNESANAASASITNDPEFADTLINPGFEKGVLGWAFGGAWTTTTDYAGTTTGSQQASIQMTDGSTDTLVSSRVRTSAGDNVEVRAGIRIDSSFDGEISVLAAFYDDTDTEISETTLGTRSDSTSGSFVTVGGEIRSPDAASGAAIKIRCDGQTAGEAVADNAVVKTPASNSDNTESRVDSSVTIINGDFELGTNEGWLPYDPSKDCQDGEVIEVGEDFAFVGSHVLRLVPNNSENQFHCSKAFPINPGQKIKLNIYGLRHDGADAAAQVTVEWLNGDKEVIGSSAYEDGFSNLWLTEVDVWALRSGRTNPAPEDTRYFRLKLEAGQLTGDETPTEIWFDKVSFDLLPAPEDVPSKTGQSLLDASEVVLIDKDVATPTIVRARNLSFDKGDTGWLGDAEIVEDYEKSHSPPYYLLIDDADESMRNAIIFEAVPGQQVMINVLARTNDLTAGSVDIGFEWLDNDRSLQSEDVETIT